MHLWTILWLKPPTALSLSSNGPVSWERQFDEAKRLLKIINSNCCNTDSGALIQCLRQFRFIYVTGGVSPVWSLSGIPADWTSLSSAAGFLDPDVMTLSHQCLLNKYSSPQDRNELLFYLKTNVWGNTVGLYGIGKKMTFQYSFFLAILKYSGKGD